MTRKPCGTCGNPADFEVEKPSSWDVDPGPWFWSCRTHLGSQLMGVRPFAGLSAPVRRISGPPRPTDTTDTP